MIVREHFPAPDGKHCIHCGHTCNQAREFSAEATCVARENGLNAAEIRPEPAYRKWAYEDADAISARIAELRAEPKCPLTADRTLYSCLRNSAKCGDSCPVKDSWIGPE